MKQELSERLTLNLDRVRNLIKVYEGLAGHGQGRRPVHSTDVLRAATVLLHSALEDFLRSLENWKLPQASEATLNDVALAGTPRRAEKFSLGKLAQYRGRTVDQVIGDSVSQHLNRKSYNSVAEIKGTLQGLGLEAPALSQYSNDLAALMERRHHIVHQADRETTAGTGHHQARSLSKLRVEAWLAAVRDSAAHVLAVTPP